MRYSEVFWNPTNTARVSGIPYPQALTAIVRAFGDAEADHGSDSRLLPATNREPEPAAATEIVT